MSVLIRVEWRDRQLAVVEDQIVPLERGREPGTLVVAAGFRTSGEPVVFRLRPTAR